MNKIILIVFLIFFSIGCNNNEKKEENKKISIEKNFKILALGDSLTAGYNLEIEESYPSKLQNKLNNSGYNYKIINAGVSGNTSKNLLSRLHLYTESYDTVLLNIGGNDGLRSLDLEQLKNNILDIIDYFPDSNIVLFGGDLPGNYGITYRNKFKNLYKEISKEKDVYYYDSFFEGLDYNLHFLNDGIHPNKQGYEIISQNIYEYLLKNKLLKKG